MSQSGRPALALAVMLLVGLMVGSYMLRSGGPEPGADELAGEEDTVVTVDTRQNRIAVRSGAGRKPVLEDRETTPDRERTSGVVTMAVDTPEVLPPLTGYIVDSFRGWARIPDAYHGDGLAVVGGALTLIDDGTSTEPRSGVLVSPAIPMRAPALAGAVRENRSLPEGAQVQLEISLSEDGSNWSPWVAVSRHVPVDGNLVAAPMQPSLANADARMADNQNSTQPVTGPSVRYRLYLSASGGESPQIEDVRVWKREYQ